MSTLVHNLNLPVFTQTCFMFVSTGRSLHLLNLLSICALLQRNKEHFNDMCGFNNYKSNENGNEAIKTCSKTQTAWKCFTETIKIFVPFENFLRGRFVWKLTLEAKTLTLFQIDENYFLWIIFRVFIKLNKKHSPSANGKWIFVAIIIISDPTNCINFLWAAWHGIDTY